MGFYTNLRILYSVCIVVILVLLNLTDANYCFRRYVHKRAVCKGLMKREAQSPESCCARNRAAGFAALEVRRGANTFICTPCSDLNLPSEEPIPTGWGEWAEWSPCSKSCMAGFQERTRSCLGGECPGANTEMKACMLRAHCPVDGNWGPWFPWKHCSASCAGGLQSRVRRCNNPPPMHGGIECLGAPEEERECNMDPCPIDGGWGEWSQLSECTTTCGPGVHERHRECDNPTPLWGGRFCQGRNIERKRCHIRMCPVDGGFSLWSEWSHCAVSCGSGKIQRTRTCDSPRPQHGGKFCEGDLQETKGCSSRRPCPIDGLWSSWTEPSQCRAPPCETGYQVRTRSCTSPRPQHGGDYCRGSQIDKIPCLNDEDCPEVEED